MLLTRTRLIPLARAAASLCVIAAAPASNGCVSFAACDTSDGANPLVDYNGGSVSGGVYMSSPWAGPFLYFPGGKRYRLFHNLGCVPREITTWGAFSELGIASGSISIVAGNMTIIEEITDQWISIKNDTCSDFYVLITSTCGQPYDGGVDGGSESSADAATPDCTAADSASE